MLTGDLNSEWLILSVLLVAVGLFAGVLAGLLGVGGGIVIVPALYHVLSYLDVDPAVRMHLAVGTSLATIIPTSIRSVLAHHKRGAVDPALLRLWALPLLVGVLGGTWLATIVGRGGLMSVFAVVALVVALHMAFGKPEWRLAGELPKGSAGKAIPAGIGAISAMMGIGGGTLSVPILTLFAYPIHRAVGTAAGFGLLIAVPASIGFIAAGWGEGRLPAATLGYVSIVGFALIVPATLLSVPLGVRLAHSMNERLLRRAFALFLALTAIRMFIDL